MGNLQIMRKRFTTVLGILGVIDLVLLVYLLWPGASGSSRTAEEQKLQQQHTALSREVTPLRGIDQKLDQTRDDIVVLNKERIPGQFSQISQEVEKLVRETGVSPEAIHYDPQKSDKGELPGIQRIAIDTTIKGEYSKVARFINALEQDKLFFVINQIALSGQEGGQVALQIKFETFLKQTAQTGGA
jgi:type IV pilus assembly protein PilO